MRTEPGGNRLPEARCSFICSPGILFVCSFARLFLCSPDRLQHLPGWPDRILDQLERLRGRWVSRSSPSR